MVLNMRSNMALNNELIANGKNTVIEKIYFTTSWLSIKRRKQC